MSLPLLLDFLRFPSISTSPQHKPDVRRCGEWLLQQCHEAGLQGQLHETPGHPVVLAKNQHRPGRHHVVLYGHYDVQPVDPLDLWLSPPFEPRVENGIIFARGATDNKGQLMAHLCGLASTMQKHADLPVNLTCLFEGEEEIGSPNLAPFLRQHVDALKCDIVAISDTGMVGPGIPTFTYGLRGIACMEVTVHGPTIDLHSGIFGGVVANPLTAISHLVASFHDSNAQISVAGFYDKVKPLQTWEREAWSKLPDGGAETLHLTGSPSLWGEAGYSDYERRWGRPTAEINGMGGGYQGAGSKTVIPSSAFAKFSFRLVPDQDPAEIQHLVEEHLKAHCPPGVTLSTKFGHFGSPYAMDPHSNFGKAAQRALRKTFNAEVALIREGGSIPIVQSFRDILGAETLLLGLALPDCQAHAPNENFPVANFTAGQALNQHLLEELAAV